MLAFFIKPAPFSHIVYIHKAPHGTENARILSNRGGVFSPILSLVKLF